MTTFTLINWIEQYPFGNVVRAVLFQDSPESLPTGSVGYFRPHEFLEFLERAGLNETDAKQLLEELIQKPAQVLRRSFNLSRESFIQLREFVSH
jgi:hypothetical protein